MVQKRPANSVARIDNFDIGRHSVSRHHDGHRLCAQLHRILLGRSPTRDWRRKAGGVPGHVFGVNFGLRYGVAGWGDIHWISALVNYLSIRISTCLSFIIRFSWKFDGGSNPATV